MGKVYTSSQTQTRAIEKHTCMTSEEHHVFGGVRRVLEWFHLSSKESVPSREA